ncbi:MAG: hypothetical protein Q8J72_12705 [Rhodocyclaceae bacterium]|nr:hypothetical protein [Rhodocyclaceae bacterium]
MSKGNRRRNWKAQAERKRTPGGYMPLPKKRDKRQPGESRRWRDGE